VARPRIPLEIAKITGRTRINPARFEGRANPQSGPLGDAPRWMSRKQVAAWALLKSEFPWLQRSDRALTEIAATIRARLIGGEDISVAELNLLRLCLGQMGGSPSDRSKVSVEESNNEADAGARYFQ
jgi:hypothetical protein